MSLSPDSRLPTPDCLDSGLPTASSRDSLVSRLPGLSTRDSLVSRLPSSPGALVSRFPFRHNFPYVRSAVQAVRWLRALHRDGSSEPQLHRWVSQGEHCDASFCYSLSRRSLNLVTRAINTVTITAIVSQILHSSRHQPPPLLSHVQPRAWNPSLRWSIHCSTNNRQEISSV
jgi:hypothetical protein